MATTIKDFQLSGFPLTISQAGSPRTAAGKAGNPCKLAKSNDTAGKAQSPHTATKAKSPCKSAKSSDIPTAGINIPTSETLFGIKDVVLRELIGLGKVEVVTRSSKLSRSLK